MELFVVNINAVDLVASNVAHLSLVPIHISCAAAVKIAGHPTSMDGNNMGRGRRKAVKTMAVNGRSCVDSKISSFFLSSASNEAQEERTPPKTVSFSEQNGKSPVCNNGTIQKHSIIKLEADDGCVPTFCASKAKRTYGNKRRVLTASKQDSKQRPNFDPATNEPPKKITNERTKDSVDNRAGVDSERKLTDYFPIRRSERQTRSRLMKNKQKEVEDALLSGLEDGLKVDRILGKGRGVVATKCFKKGEFVVEYSGELIGIAQARQREMIYARDQNAGCYMYYFLHNNSHYCVDATEESNRLGRLVNHSRTNGNLVTKTFVVGDVPHLILVAKRDIEQGEELLYDYGDRSKVSVASHPWLAT